MRSLYKSPRPRYNVISPRAKIVNRSARPPIGTYRQHQKNGQTYKESIREILLNDNSDEIEKYATLAIMGEKLPMLTPSQYGLIAKDLESRRLFFAEKGHLNESLQATEAIERVKALQMEAMKLEAQKIAQSEITLRKGHSNTDYSIFNHKNIAAEDRMDMKYEDRLQNLQEKHLREKEELDFEWSSVSKQRLYFHDSQKLNELKYLRDKLLGANDIDKAAVIEGEIRELERVEREENTRLLTNDYNRACEVLEAKQQNEIEALAYDKTMKKKLFKAKVKTEATTFENRKRALKVSESLANDKERFWKTRGRTARPSMTSYNNPRPTIPVIYRGRQAK